MGVIALDRESDGDIEDDLFGIIELGFGRGCC